MKRNWYFVRYVKDGKTIREETRDKAYCQRLASNYGGTWGIVT
jgi:hypothetical protein